MRGNRNPASGTSESIFHEELLVIIENQTIFNLSTTPKGTIFLYFKGICQKIGTDFLVTGTTLTWISTDFNLSPGEKLEVFYIV